MTTLPGQRPEASTSAIVSSATRFCSSCRVEDRRAVAAAHVVALTVLGRRVVDLEEELQQVAVARSASGSKTISTRLGVVAVVAVGGVRGVAARVADAGRDHARAMADQLLRAPEAAAGEDRGLGCVVIVRPPSWCAVSRLAVVTVALGLELVHRDEAQRRGVDAVAQAARLAPGRRRRRGRGGCRALAERTSVRTMPNALSVLLDDVGRLDRPREARPAGAAVELVGRREQRLARDDVDVDAVVVVVPELVAERRARCRLLRHRVLPGGQLGRWRSGPCGTGCRSWELLLCEPLAAAAPKRTAAGIRKFPPLDRTCQPRTPARTSR